MRQASCAVDDTDRADARPLPNVTYLLANDKKALEIDEVAIDGQWRGALSATLSRAIGGAAEQVRDGRITRGELYDYLYQGGTAPYREPADAAGAAGRRCFVILWSQCRSRVCIEPLRDRYEVNEPIRFRVCGDSAYYVYLYSVDNETGDSELIFPNELESDDHYPSGRSYLIPNRDAELFSDRPGIEQVVMVGSREPIDLARKRRAGRWPPGLGSGLAPGVGSDRPVDPRFPDDQMGTSPQRRPTSPGLLSPLRHLTLTEMTLSTDSDERFWICNIDRCTERERGSL